MKSKFFLFLLLVLCQWSMVPGPAFAQAEDEATPPPQSEKMSGWDEGFWVRSADDKFKIKLGAIVQLEEKVEKKSGLQKLATGSGLNQQFTAADSFNDSFLIRRGNLLVSGTVYEKVDFSAVLNTRTGPPGGTQRFNFFADFTVNILPQFRVVGGVINLPLDFLGEDSSRWFLTIEPPLVATQEDGLKGFTIARQSFGAPPDLGLKLEADLGKYVTVAAGAANGPGFQGENTNNELSYGGRVQINAMGDPFLGQETDFGWSEDPRLMFNIGTMMEDNDAQDEFVPSVLLRWAWTSSAGSRFRYRGFQLNAEGYVRYTRGLNIPFTQDTSRDGKLRDVGYYINAGYFVIPKKLELALTASQVMREGPDNDANEFGGGINWYIFKNHVKWQLDYTNVLDYDDVEGLNNATYHRIRTMFSVML
ncbi:MAG: hypothetical protein Q8P84_07915 [Deltaproteobacteria bacterium]|nr:hypothetical protein [Deltaproteobacteria bacterium]